MDDVMDIKRKKKRQPVKINGITYIPIEDACARIPCQVATMYQWNSEGRHPPGKINYLGGVYYEERGIEPFKKSLIRF